MIKKESEILESLGNGRTIAEAAAECSVDHRTVKKVIAEYNLMPMIKPAKVLYSLRVPENVSKMIEEAVRNTNITISELLNAMILSCLKQSD